jgi:hypothetical protein
MRISLRKEPQRTDFNQQDKTTTGQRWEKFGCSFLLEMVSTFFEVSFD